MTTDHTPAVEALAESLDWASRDHGTYDWDWYKDDAVVPAIIRALAAHGYVLTPAQPVTETPPFADIAPCHDPDCAAHAQPVTETTDLRAAARDVVVLAHPSSDLPGRYIVHGDDLARLRAALDAATPDTGSDLRAALHRLMSNNEFITHDLLSEFLAEWDAATPDTGSDR